MQLRRATEVRGWGDIATVVIDATKAERRFHCLRRSLRVVGGGRHRGRLSFEHLRRQISTVANVFIASWNASAAPSPRRLPP